MNRDLRLFKIERHGEVLILVPKCNLSELEMTSWDEAIQDVTQELEASSYRSLILDFSGTDYYGSTALGFFIKLWKRVRKADGNMVFCNVSEHELEILKLTRLAELWTICDTREEALRFLGEE